MSGTIGVLDGLELDVEDDEEPNVEETTLFDNGLLAHPLGDFVSPNAPLVLSAHPLGDLISQCPPCILCGLSFT